MKKNSYSLCALVILTLLMHTICFAQEQELKRQLAAYTAQAMPEKLFVHTDKNFYVTGEICWFKVYNVDGFFNKPLGVSKVAYAELLDKNNKPVLQAKIALNDGNGSGSLQIPVTLNSGRYLLRAYTRWMQNFSAAYFFEKPVTIINTRRIYVPDSQKQTDKYDIQFFPEGGNFVNGIETKMGFRAVDKTGTGLACNGAIINERSDTIAQFKAFQFGMGNFLLKPEAGHTYTAVINLPNGKNWQQPLPAATQSGYAIRLENTGNDLQLIVQSPGNTGSSAVYLLAHTRGSVKVTAMQPLHEGKATFSINAAKLGDGVSQLTVFDAERRPVAERLFFKRPAAGLSLLVKPDATGYDQRKKVSISVSSTGAGGKPVDADMSVAVYRADSLVQPDLDIESYLWFKSDLTGNVESPSWYFAASPEEAGKAADNLMLTQGWRRFNWNDVLKNQKPAFAFVPEYKGHVIKGKVINNANGQPVAGAEAYLSAVSTRTQFRGTFSDDTGAVKFEMNNFFGNGEVIVQSPAVIDGPRHIEIENPFSIHYTSNNLPAFNLAGANPAAIAGVNKAVQVQNGYLGPQLKQFIFPHVDTLPFYRKPDKTFFLDDYVRFTTIEEVLREYVPEVNVRKREGKYSLPVFDNIRREFFTIEPLILLDGVHVPDADRIMGYDPLKIRRLDVVARMYYYGNMFFGGIVNFVTYNGDLPGYELDPQATVLDYETLQMQREFFSPVYETPEQQQGRLPDFRELLYWSPAVKTNTTGKTNIDFYTSDIPGRYVVVLQGISNSGVCGSAINYFDVRENTHGLVTGK